MTVTGITYLRLLVPFDRASVILASPQELLECYALKESDVVQFEIQQQAIPCLPLLAQIINSGEGILVSDTRADPQWVIIPGVNDAACWMGVPLVAGGKTVGLYAVGKGTAGFSTQEHYRLAAALAGQAAIAVQNALLYEAERAQFRKLQESQSQLIQVEKLSALGRLTASIAHEINNPIQAVQVLVVEDDANIRLFLDHLLRREGYRITLAPDGEKALEHVQVKTFDLVILDLNLGKGISGMDVLTVLRNTACARN